MGLPHLRFVTPEDVPRLAEIEARSFSSQESQAWSRTMLEGEIGTPFGFQLVASVSAHDPPLGYAAFRTAADEAELLRLAVLPEARGRGLGRALVERGLERLAWEGLGECFLEVRKGNTAARRLYEATGFVLAGRRRGYYPDGADALVYRRQIDPPPDPEVR